MRSCVKDGNYNTRVEPSDWRYSAAIVGLIKYFRFHHDDYEIYFDEELETEYLCFNHEDLLEEKLLRFIEWYYSDELYHQYIQEQLLKEEFLEEEIKILNEKLQGNTSMKKIFGKIKFDGKNREEILLLIEKNQDMLTKETFRNKKNMYANYGNTNQMFSEAQDNCRLVGYSIDIGKKGKSNAYNFDPNTFVGRDDFIFDWIPFGFLGDREAFFINDNYTIERLSETNLFLENKVKEDLKKKETLKALDVRKVLFKTMIEVSEFIDFDVEVIYKNREKDFFETLYIRKESIEILKSIKNYDEFCFSLKVTDDYYINIQKKVTDCILNLVLTDEIIELFLKEKKDQSDLISRLIDVNIKMRGGKEEMKKSMKVARECGEKVASDKANFTDNKLKSYRQKLTSAIVFKDYDRVCQILLQLSNYANVQFDFAYDLFENFEDNKDLAYTFINALRRGDAEKNRNGEGK